MSCSGCSARREAISKAAKDRTLVSAKEAATFVVKSSAKDISDRIRFLTVRRNVL